MGRTIFSLSLGSGSDRHEAYTDTNSHPDNNTLSDVSIDRNIDIHTVTEPISHSDSDTHFKTGKMTAHAHTERDKIFCDICATTKVQINTLTDGDTHLADTGTDVNSKNNTPNHTPATAHTHAVTPTDLYNDNTHNDTRFNDTYTHPDTDLYFLYYLSQYFNLVSSVLFYLSAAVNPLLYNLMSARYRHAVHSLMHTHSHTQSLRMRTLTTRPSTTTL